MRPERFQDWLVKTLQDRPGVTRVQTLADAGVSKYRYGVAVVRNGREEQWQIMHQFADGERNDSSEQPVEGTPYSTRAPESDAAPDVWMAGAIGAAECPEIVRTERWTDRPAPSSQAGVTAFFHNGSRDFIRPL